MLDHREEEEFRKIADALASTDPKLVRAAEPSRLRGGIGVVAALAGLALMVVAVAVNLVVLGIVGFLVALVGTTFAYSAIRNPRFGSQARRGGTAGTKRPAGVTDWAERRWQQRRGGQ